MKVLVLSAGLVCALLMVGCGEKVQAPDPVILNTGGPGDSNLDQFLPLLAGPAGPALLAQRDAVVIELRGAEGAEGGGGIDRTPPPGTAGLAGTGVEGVGVLDERRVSRGLRHPSHAVMQGRI